MAKTSTTLSIVAIAAILLLGILSYAVFFKAPQTQIPGQTNAGAGGVGYISTGSTALQLIVTDKLNPGTQVGASSLISTDGQAFIADDLTPAGSPNQVLDILIVNNTGYHNALIKGYKVPTSPTGVASASLLGNASVTITVFNTDSVKTVADGSVNQTVSSGGAYNMKIRMDGQDKKSTNDMTCIIEASDKLKANTVTLSGFGATFVGSSTPSSYSAGAGSQVWVYDVTPIEGAVSPEGTLAISSKTAQSLAGTNLKITCKTKENFLDGTTGKVMYAIEDSLGVAKSMASYSTTVYFS